jgi:hypothetical protein
MATIEERFLAALGMRVLPSRNYSGDAVTTMGPLDGGSVVRV